VIVLDASAAVELVAWTPRGRRISGLLRARRRGGIHAPHLIDIEVTHALRGLVIGGKLPADVAQEALSDFQRLRLRRYPARGLLLDRMWQLRHNLTAYDAAYVALAEALDADLLTADRKLQDAPGHEARVTVV
jgi:predicted nucleic acid-binding protein